MKLQGPVSIPIVCWQVIKTILVDNSVLANSTCCCVVQHDKKKKQDVLYFCWRVHNQVSSQIWESTMAGGSDFLLRDEIGWRKDGRSLRGKEILSPSLSPFSYPFTYRIPEERACLQAMLTNATFFVRICNLRLILYGKFVNLLYMMLPVILSELCTKMRNLKKQYKSQQFGSCVGHTA